MLLLLSIVNRVPLIIDITILYLLLCALFISFVIPVINYHALKLFGICIDFNCYV